MARERIIKYLGASAWTRAVHQYIQILIGKASIEGIELAGAMTPLVQ
jgi:peptidyl-prolyl cis-trans isomerase C